MLSISVGLSAHSASAKADEHGTDAEQPRRRGFGDNLKARVIPLDGGGVVAHGIAESDDGFNDRYARGCVGVRDAELNPRVTVVDQVVINVVCDEVAEVGTAPELQFNERFLCG